MPTTTKTQPKAAEQGAESGSEDVVFSSPHARLIVYDGKKIAARFFDGLFHTSDAKLIKLLRAHALVSEGEPRQ